MKFGIVKVGNEMECGDGKRFFAVASACSYERSRILSEVEVCEVAFCQGVFSVLRHLGMTTKTGVGLYDLTYLAALKLASTSGHEVIYPPACSCCENLVPKAE